MRADAALRSDAVTVGVRRLLATAVAGGVVAAGALMTGATGAQPAPGETGVYAPLDRPGPALDVPVTLLRKALTCTEGVRHAVRDPILLVPGTNLDPQPNFSWNYERAFAAKHWPYCTITLPFHTMGDVQVAGEYIVHALRTIARMSGRRV